MSQIYGRCCNISYYFLLNPPMTPCVIFSLSYKTLMASRSIPDNQWSLRKYLSKVKKCYMVILKGKTRHNTYFYVSCQLRVTNCSNLLGLWGSPQWETYSAETERPRHPEGDSDLVTLLVIKHGALWGRQIRDLVEKCIYLRVGISEILFCFFTLLVIGSDLRSGLAPPTLMNMKSDISKDLFLLW